MDNQTKIIKFEQTDTEALSYRSLDMDDISIIGNVSADTVSTDVTVLPNSISYYENKILIPLSTVIDKYTHEEDILEYYYPVSSTIEVMEKTYDPNHYLPGAWIRFGEGRTPISVDANKLDLLETSLGTYSHVLTVEEMPAHNHRLGTSSETRVIRGSNYTDVGEGSNYASYNYNTMSTGGGLKHNNTMPYMVTFKWKRVS